MAAELKIHLFQVGDRVQQTEAWLEHCGLNRHEPFVGTLLEWDREKHFFMVQWDGVPGPSIARPGHIEPVKPPSRWKVLMGTGASV